MIYFGSGLPSLREYGGPEPSLLDPTLTVAPVPDYRGDTVGCWPAYDRLDPRARAAYLDWLAGDRCDPGANIGYVFLFFYGLERRLLWDAQSSPEVAAEYPPLRAEVVRLRSIYADNGAFAGCSAHFLDTIDLLFAQDTPHDQRPPREPATGYELPKGLRIKLGLLAKAHEPIPWEWALSWYLCHPETRLLTPARRCASEFRALFAGRYVEELGHGLTIKAPRARLKIAYHPASASFAGKDVVVKMDLPEIGPLAAVPGKIVGIADQCVSDLDSYSRLLGKDQTAKGTLPAIALLPTDLVQRHRGQATTDLRRALDAALGEKGIGAVRVRELAALASGILPAKPTKRDCVTLAQLLGKLGYGMEPDVRQGGATLKPDGTVILFRSPQDAPTTASWSYALASLLVHLFWIVASADGRVSSEEANALLGYLRDGLELSASEQVRLKAHVRWIALENPGMAGVAKRAATLPYAQREDIARFLALVAAAEGGVDRTEVVALEKLYRMLELPIEAVHKHVHEASLPSVPSAGPVTVAAAEPGHPGYRVPVPTTSAPSGQAVKVDLRAIEAKLAETAHVSALLSSIFDDEEETCPPEVPASEEPCAAGLDGQHTALLREFAAHSEVTREDFEALAASHRLLPDGALDTVNDAALELCDELLCEGEDPITINAEVLQEMLS